MSFSEQTLAAAERLDKSMSDLTGEMRSLRAYGQRNRRMIWALAASLAIDVLLSFMLGFVAIQASNASQKATEATSVAAQNKQNAKVTCEASNIARDAQVQLWTYVLDLSAPTATSAQKKQIADLRTYIHIVFAHRDCDNPSLPAIQTPTPPTR